MTKIALISDIHFGVKKNSEKFLEFQKKFFYELLIPTIKQNNIDHLFILGDLFDNPENINVLVKNTVIKIFNKLINTFPHIKITFLVGNHDIYYKNTLETTSLSIFEHFPKIEVLKNIKEFIIDDKSILCVPWLVKNSKMHEEFDNIINSNKVYDYCFGHFEINQFEIIPTIYENKGFPIELFKNFNKVFSGHFHIKNTIDNINYLGSPYQITWNDYGTTKGITILDVENSNVEFIENNICPKHLKIKLSEVIKDKNILKTIKNNFIKFYWDVKINADKKLEIEEKIKSLNSMDLSFIEEIITTIDSSNIDDESNDIQGSPIEFLNTWYDTIKHPEDIDVTELKLITNNLYLETLKD